MKCKRKQHLGYVDAPQPDVVQKLHSWTAMCVRNVDVHDPQANDSPFKVIVCVLSLCYTQVHGFIILGSEEAET